MYKIIFLSIAAVFLVSSCTKDMPKEMQNKNQQMLNDSVNNKVRKQSLEDTSSGDISDKKTQEMIKAADDADAKYVQTKSEVDKKECIAKQFAAANYLMFEANLSAKKKYPTALKRYKRIVELDPSHRIAHISVKQIEDIYRSRGLPIPE